MAKKNDKKKKKSNNKKPTVKVQGNKIVGGLDKYRKNLEKEIQSALKANDDKWTSKDSKTFNQTFKKLTKDGALGGKDREKLIQAMQKGGLGWQETALLSGLLGNTFDSARYQDFVGGFKADSNKFLSNQSGRLDALLGGQTDNLNRQLASLRSATGKQLSSFRGQLAESDRQFSSILGGQRAEWAKDNKASLAAIKRYQQQIASIPGYTPISQISSNFRRVDAPQQLAGFRQISGGPETVRAPNQLQNFSLNRAPIQLQRTPARTGMSQRQEQSRDRQRMGIQGLRRM